MYFVNGKHESTASLRNESGRSTARSCIVRSTGLTQRFKHSRTRLPSNLWTAVHLLLYSDSSKNSKT